MGNSQINNVKRRLTFDEIQKEILAENKLIFQDCLISKGVTSFRYLDRDDTNIDEKFSFKGTENQVNYFNRNLAEISKNIFVGRFGPQWEKLGDDIQGDSPDDQFGYDVSLSANGEIVAIGSFNNTSGIVKIFKYDIQNQGGWVQEGNTITTTVSNDRHGHSISLSGDGSVVAISSFSDSSALREALRIYRNINGTWEKIGNSISRENNQSTYLGGSISLSYNGLVVAMGLPDNDDNSSDTNSNFGKVFVYEYNSQNNSWEQKGTSIIGERNDKIGVSVSLSGDGHVLAYRNNDDNSDSNVHLHTKVFEFKDNDWIQMGNTFGNVDNRGDGDVSLNYDGSIMAIGESRFESFKGRVQVYKYKPSENDWDQIGNDIIGESLFDNSGISISLSADGNILAIAAKNNNNYKGHVRVYENKNDQWVRIAKDIDGEATGDQSGWSVSLSADGLVLAIGAPFNNGDNGENSGHVRVYQTLKRNTWSQEGLDITGESTGDLSGSSLSLSSDGSVLAISSKNNNNTNGVFSGNVRVYRNVDGFWNQIGEGINGQSSNDKSGNSICLSEDGTFLAVGAENNDNNTGHVLVYKNENDSWQQFGNELKGKNVGDKFGASVSITKFKSGGIGGTEKLYIAVGSSNGYIQIYTEEALISSPQFEQIGQDLEGNIVSFSKNSFSIVVGNTISKKVEVYSLQNNIWEKIGQSITCNLIDNGGSSPISLRGQFMAVGLKNDSHNNSGFVRVYRIENNVWQQLGNDIYGDNQSDLAGYSVSLSSDGSILGIGVPENSDNNTGYVSMYKIANEKWHKIGKNILGENTNDKSGSSISISNDGKIIAIGSPENGDNGQFSGKTRVYKFVGWAIDNNSF